MAWPLALACCCRSYLSRSACFLDLHALRKSISPPFGLSHVRGWRGLPCIPLRKREMKQQRSCSDANSLASGALAASSNAQELLGAEWIPCAITPYTLRPSNARREPADFWAGNFTLLGAERSREEHFHSGHRKTMSVQALA